MTTKELIKQLQEADPSGELHVRIEGEGGWPFAIYSCAGYWDGACRYEDDDHNLHVDWDNPKVRIHTRCTQDWVYDRFHKVVKKDPPRVFEMVPVDQKKVIVHANVWPDPAKRKRDVLNGIEEEWHFWDNILKEMNKGE